MHYQEGPATEFVKLLREAFPEHARLPECCPISRAVELNQNDLSDVVEVVTRCGGRGDLVARLRTKHRGGGACHREEYDWQFWNVWTEACAFAWAVEVARFGRVRFTDDDGKPDLLVDSGTWLEAKTVETSRPETRTLERMARAGNKLQVPVMRGPFSPSQPHRTLIKKFCDGLKDALAKRDQQGRGDIIVFFSVDIDRTTDERAAYCAIRAWARDAAVKRGARVVMISGNLNWREPFLDTVIRAV